MDKYVMTAIDTRQRKSKGFYQTNHTLKLIFLEPDRICSSNLRFLLILLALNNVQISWEQSIQPCYPIVEVY